MLKHIRIVGFAAILAAALAGLYLDADWGIGLTIVAVIVGVGWLYLKTFKSWFQGNRTKLWAWLMGLPAGVAELLRQMDQVDWSVLLKPEYLIYVIVGSAILKWVFREDTSTPPGMFDEFDRR